MSTFEATYKIHYVNSIIFIKFDIFKKVRYDGIINKVYTYNLNTLLPLSVHVDFDYAIKEFFVLQTGRNIQEIDTEIKKEFSKGCTEIQEKYFK